MDSSLIQETSDSLPPPRTMPRDPLGPKSNISGKVLCAVEGGVESIKMSFLELLEIAGEI